jgi:hypothetical protein
MKDLIKFPSHNASFSHSQNEELTFHQEDLIELFPFGVSLATDDARPFLLLKSDDGEHTLPVALNPLEAGVTLSQANKAVAPVTPHKFTSLLMQAMNIQAKQCVFVQIKGVHQYVRIYLSGHPTVNSIKLRADEAMSLCLHLQIPIFATKAFINQSRVMSAEIEGLAQGLRKNFHITIKNHPYVM